MGNALKILVIALEIIAASALLIRLVFGKIDEQPHPRDMDW